MKKCLPLISIVFCCQMALCQVTDTLKTVNDTIAKPAPPAAPAVVAKDTAATKSRRDTRPLKDRIDLGLSTSFWITPSQTYVEIAPMLAYRFPKILITGIGYRYIYRHQRTINNDLNSYGPNLFAKLELTKRIYLWTEYEILKSEYYDESYISNEESRSTSSVDSWFGGIGYVRSVGRKGGISVQVLYNFLYESEENNPYYSPVTYRVGYFF